jgi:ATP-binding cassette subfamily C (CFTR/MRP) protein 10
VSHESSEPNNQTNTSYETVTYFTDESNVSYYLTVYAVFAGLNSVFTLFRAFLFAYGGIHAATNVHRQLLNTIMKVNSIMLSYVAIKTVVTVCL